MITIRKATNNNSVDITNLILNIWINEYHFDVNKDDAPDLQDIESHYHKNNGLFFVAVKDDVLIGTIAGSALSENEWVLKRMFVNENYRRSGIAQLLLEKLLSEIFILTGNEKSSVFLSTREIESPAPKAFYLKNGFCVVEKLELPVNFPYFYEDNLFMMRSDLKI